MLRSVENADISGKKVFVRCDLDVVDIEGKIKDTLRLERGIPTLKHIITGGGFPLIAGHLAEKKLSTEILRPFFEKALGSGNFELLENLRQNPGEKGNDQNFAKKIINGCEIYVNESFATCHREHASIVTIPKILPAYAGMNLIAEIKALDSILKNPKRPFVGIVGGAKIESKLPTLTRLIEICDFVLVGGLLGQQWTGQIPKNLYLPVDYVGNNADIGPQTIEQFTQIVKTAKTILWAGPMGKFEQKEFENGTKQLAETISQSDAYSIVGGGDTTTAIAQFGLINKFGFVSTGGGAMLDYISKGSLPGIKALEENNA